MRESKDAQTHRATDQGAGRAEEGAAIAAGEAAAGRDDNGAGCCFGSFVLERLEQEGDDGHQQGEMDGKQLRQWLAREFPAYLSRDADRLLFVDLFRPQNETDIRTERRKHGLESTVNEAARTPRDDAQRSTGEDGGTVQP